MTLELFGLPAAGKSTAAAALRAEGWVLVALGGRGELLSRAARMHLRHPLRAARLLFYIVRFAGPPRALYLVFINLYLRSFALADKAARLPRAVIDQGPFQLLLSLKPLSKRRCERLAALLPKPDYLVMLEVPEDERRRRLGARGVLPRAEFGEAYAKAFSGSRPAAYAAAKEVLGRLMPPGRLLAGADASAVRGLVPPAGRLDLP